LDKLTAAANASADWYEGFAKHMPLAPFEFAMSYITRSGRVNLNRLRTVSPSFIVKDPMSRRRRGHTGDPAASRTAPPV